MTGGHRPVVLRKNYVVRIKLATWNVAYGRGCEPNRRRREVLDQVDADVWVLTETHCELTPGDGYKSIASDVRCSPRNKRVDEGSSWVTIWARTALSPRREHVTCGMRTAACTLDTKRGPFWIFGTVLPWYTDREAGSVADEAARQKVDWLRLSSRAALPQVPGCVAGDFNVDLGGGPHYYGSRESKAAVQKCLDDAGLTLLTGHQHLTAPDSNFGLIDHIAVSHKIADPGVTRSAWGTLNARGQKLSDHPGVAVVIDVDW